MERKEFQTVTFKTPSYEKSIDKKKEVDGKKISKNNGNIIFNGVCVFMYNVWNTNYNYNIFKLKILKGTKHLK